VRNLSYLERYVINQEDAPSAFTSLRLANQWDFSILSGAESVSTTRVSTKEGAAVVEWKLKEIIGPIQLMKFPILNPPGFFLFISSIIDNNQQNAPLLGLIFRLISTMTAMQSDVLILYQYRWLMGALKNYR
jgi:hypothetical protein